MVIDTAKLCRRGGRDINQDCAGAFEANGRLLLVVCDGLGAYDGSGIASRICADALASFVNCGERMTADGINALFKAAHEKITAAKLGGAISPSSCTTAAAGLSDGNDVAVAHIGDSRVYVYERGEPSFRTTDHSVAQLDVDRGIIVPGELRFHKDQNKLTRVLGGRYFVLPDVRFLGRPIAEGDAFLLCTDGWWEHTEEFETEEDLLTAGSSAEVLARGESRIIARASGAYDNYSAVLAVARK